MKKVREVVDGLIESGQVWNGLQQLSQGLSLATIHGVVHLQLDEHLCLVYFDN